MEARMENSVNLKKHGTAARMARHPLGALVGGLAAAAVCGILGSAHGDIVVAVMAALGAIVGAPFGSMLAASFNREE
jgi:outer membrane lipoprotein SlyB